MYTHIYEECIRCISIYIARHIRIHVYTRSRRPAGGIVACVSDASDVVQTAAEENFETFPFFARSMLIAVD